jgi:hypothetical protein
MFRAKRATALAFGLTLLAACATNTTLTSTWKAPDAQTRSPIGKSIAAVFVTNVESLRRAGENALAADLSARGARGFGTYYLLPGEQHFDAEAAQARLMAAGADAVVMMRVVGEDQRITYTPGYVVTPPYRGFGPYWGFGWRTVYQPGTVRTDTLVSVETLVYSLRADQTSQLLWASTSRTTNPSGLEALVRQVANATANAMVREGFLAR